MCPWHPYFDSVENIDFFKVFSYDTISLSLMAAV